MQNNDFIFGLFLLSLIFNAAGFYIIAGGIDKIEKELKDAKSK